MPLIDINNPEVIKFLVENYEKEARLRMRWNELHAEQLNSASKLDREAKGYCDLDVIQSTMEFGMTATTRDNISNGRNRRTKPIRDVVHIPGIADLRKDHSIVNVGLGDPKSDPRLARPDTDLSIDPIMRPIPTKQKEILYKGRPDFGRTVYLKNRTATASPEDKYYFAECCGWDYGWRLKDSAAMRAPEYGRVWRLSREKSRTGPQPDPAHYKDAGKLSHNC